MCDNKDKKCNRKGKGCKVFNDKAERPPIPKLRPPEIRPEKPKPEEKKKCCGGTCKKPKPE